MENRIGAMFEGHPIEYIQGIEGKNNNIHLQKGQSM